MLFAISSKKLNEFLNLINATPSTPYQKLNLLLYEEEVKIITSSKLGVSCIITIKSSFFENFETTPGIKGTSPKRPNFDSNPHLEGFHSQEPHEVFPQPEPASTHKKHKQAQNLQPKAQNDFSHEQSQHHVLSQSQNRSPQKITYYKKSTPYFHGLSPHTSFNPHEPTSIPSTPPSPNPLEEALLAFSIDPTIFKLILSLGSSPSNDNAFYTRNKFLSAESSSPPDSASQPPEMDPSTTSASASIFPTLIFSIRRMTSSLNISVSSRSLSFSSDLSLYPSDISSVSAWVDSLAPKNQPAKGDGKAEVVFSFKATGKLLNCIIKEFSKTRGRYLSIGVKNVGEPENHRTAVSPKKKGARRRGSENGRKIVRFACDDKSFDVGEGEGFVSDIEAAKDVLEDFMLEPLKPLFLKGVRETEEAWVEMFEEGTLRISVVKKDSLRGVECEFLSKNVEIRLF